MDACPSWASTFLEIGRRLGTLNRVEVGRDCPHLVLSVPTGQFVVWLIAGGVLEIEPPKLGDLSPGRRHATWNLQLGRMDDCVFDPHLTNNELFTFRNAGGFSVRFDWPAREIPEETPLDRGGAGLAKTIEDRFRGLPGMKSDWYLWYARHSLSPIVVVGHGREYLYRQREELIQKASTWFDPRVAALLSEDSKQTLSASRTYFHPFMTLSVKTGHDKPWLRKMAPRLVIYTSWEAWRQSHPTLFAGTPKVILANRRVVGNLAVESYLSGTTTSAPLEESLSGLKVPYGIFVRSFEEVAQPDSGDIGDGDGDGDGDEESW